HHKPEWVENSLSLQSPLSRDRAHSRKPTPIHADPVSGPYGNYIETIAKRGYRFVADVRLVPDSLPPTAPEPKPDPGQHKVARVSEEYRPSLSSGLGYAQLAELSTTAHPA